MKTSNLILLVIGILLLILHLSNYYFEFMGHKISHNFALGSLFCFISLLQQNINFKKMKKLELSRIEKYLCRNDW